ncbi:MAG: thioredoxin [Clostridia bacterium]
MSVTVITQDNFETEVLKNNKTVLIDFWASWCGPCRMLSPLVDEFAENHAEIAVGKVNIDDQGALAEKFGVMSIPTLIVFKNGEIVNKSVGAIPMAKIENLVK